MFRIIMTPNSGCKTMGCMTIERLLPKDECIAKGFSTVDETWVKTVSNYHLDLEEVPILAKALDAPIEWRDK